MTSTYGYDTARLPDGIHRRFVDTANGLRMHFLEVGDRQTAEKTVLLLHGFPELAYSWRKVMGPLAAAGYYVIAPDQRGYGRTTGSDNSYETDLAPFRQPNLVKDAMALLQALDIAYVDAVIGHDFGSSVAANAALIRPDIFRAVAMMSAPYAGPPTWASAGQASAVNRVQPDLAALDTPRKHYHWYYSTREADADMTDAPQGIHDFLRAYYHMKSADWRDNEPHELGAWQAEDLALLPRYYVMDLDATMAESVAPHMPNADFIAACAWLPDRELQVYAEEFKQTSFQGGLNWYRCGTGTEQTDELRLFAGRTIDVPACFIAGASDWGIHQVPGVLAKMQKQVCRDFRALHLIDGAGHWVQQEKPAETAAALCDFLNAL